jgi:3-hydroxyisobutyrate dehydrogenase-like beta-hydroxyacid dehydrogenase
MKLVVNTLLGIGMQAIAEAVAFGEKAGLERKRLRPPSLLRRMSENCRER